MDIYCPWILRESYEFSVCFIWEAKKVDISFKAGNEKFNYRVCAVILHGGKILAMHDERSPYFYLPGAASASARRQKMLSSGK